MEFLRGGGGVKREALIFISSWISSGVNAILNNLQG